MYLVILVLAATDAHTSASTPLSHCSADNLNSCSFFPNLPTLIRPPPFSSKLVTLSPLYLNSSLPLPSCPIFHSLSRRCFQEVGKAPKGKHSSPATDPPSAVFKAPSPQ